MKQILAIFAKDARRFWPEIAACISLLTAFVLIYPATWRTPLGYGAVAGGRWLMGESATALLGQILVGLIPIGWLVLIARAVHCERLVGDTQFWLTRPYDWRKLFVAKLLFFVAFLYAPFLLAQCVLLREGGLSPSQHFGALLFNLLLLTIVGVLPVIALSSLTTGFGRLVLVLLAVVLLIVVVAAVGSNMPAHELGSVPDLLSGTMGLSLIFCGSLAAAVFMYARRRAKMGWLILFSLTVVLGSTAFFDPDSALVEHYYPALKSEAVAPVTLLYGARSLDQPPATLSVDKRSVDVAVPMTATGVHEGYVVVPQALRVMITTARGVQWESPWQGYYDAHFVPGESGTLVRFRMPRSTFDQLESSAVTLHFSFALASARRASTSVLALPTEDFTVPEIGMCTPEHWPMTPDQIVGIMCRAAMNQPHLTFVSSTWNFGPCQSSSTETPKQMPTGVWLGDLDLGPAEFGITSVWQVPVHLPNPQFTGNNPAGHSWRLCAGTPTSFSQYRMEKRVREDITVPNFRLPELAMGDKIILRDEN
jgi:hypothetical protein